MLVLRLIETSRWLVFVIVVLMYSLATPRSAISSPLDLQGDDQPRSLEHRCPAVIVARESVVVMTENGNRFAGTGFVFEDARIIATALHVVANSDVRSAIDRAGRSYQLRLVAIDRLLDLAILEADRAVDGAIPLQASQAMVGRETFTIGHPDGGEINEHLTPGLYRWVVAHGMVAAVSGGWLLTDSSTGPGASGSPVLSCEGRVFGVLSGMTAHLLYTRSGSSDALHRLLANRRDVGGHARTTAIAKFEVALSLGSGDQLGAGFGLTWLPSDWWGVRSMPALSSNVFYGDLRRIGRIGVLRVPVDVVFQWSGVFGARSTIDGAIGVGWKRTWTDDLFAEMVVGTKRTDDFLARASLRLTAGIAFASVALEIDARTHPRMSVWSQLGVTLATF